MCRAFVGFRPELEHVFAARHQSIASRRCSGQTGRNATAHAKSSWAFKTCEDLVPFWNKFSKIVRSDRTIAREQLHDKAAWGCRGFTMSIYLLLPKRNLTVTAETGELGRWHRRSSLWTFLFENTSTTASLRHCPVFINFSLWFLRILC